MDYSTYLSFLRDDLVYSFVIILVSFLLGWLLYNHVILRKICLRDSLFEKDNLAAWIEFIGAFIFPTLFLAAKAIEGSAVDAVFPDLAGYQRTLADLLISVVYIAAYLLLFTGLRMLSGGIVGALGIKDEAGMVSLNNEVYTQKNIAASLFSTALSTAFVTMIVFLDFVPGYFVTSIFKLLTVLVFTLAALAVYTGILRRRTSLSNEIFIDNNIAAGVNFLGFVFAVETILYNAIGLQVQFDLLEVIVVSFIGLVLLGVLFAFFKWLFCRLINVNIWNEIYEQNNVGAAIGEVALYVGIANVIVHFIK